MASIIVRRDFRVGYWRGAALYWRKAGSGYAGLLCRRGITKGMIGEGGRYWKEMDLTLSFLSHHQGSDPKMSELLSTGP